MSSTLRARVAHHRLGFTLIELLVVMLILALLIGLLVPAVQSARDAARRTSSINNLKQIQLATANYEAARQYFPPSWQPTLPDEDGNINGWSVHALILPYMEQTVLHSKIDFDLSYEDAPPVETADGRETLISAMRVPTYLSPSEPRDEPRFSSGIAEHYPVNYAANCGVWFVYDPATGMGGEGAFYPNSRLTDGQFGDGLSFTIGFAEVKAWNPYYRNVALEEDQEIPLTPEALVALGGDFKESTGHTEWVDGRVHQIGFTSTFTPNSQVLSTESGREYDVDWTNQQEGKSDTVKTYAAVTARSYFSGGVHVSRMDGSVHFVTDEVNLGVWRALTTRNGGEVLPSNDSLPDLLESADDDGTDGGTTDPGTT